MFALSPSASQGEVLSASRAFSALTTFMLLSQAVGNFIPTVLGLMVALSCAERYAQFMSRSSETGSTVSLQKHYVGSQVSGSVPLENMTTLPDGICAQASDCSVGWKGSPDILSRISFTIYKGQLTMIAGGANSGKTTLLKALLGEMKREGRPGTLQSTLTEAALCTQKPWLVNESFLSNVLGDSEYDNAWFTTVTDACGLKSDIQRLPFGTNTAVGMEGLRLSGGQRTRLVRCYRFDIMITSYSREKIGTCSRSLLSQQCSRLG